MFPFWELVIAPVIEAAAARRVVEIGALRGETTQLMLDRLGPEAELHVIDPVPDFDPAEHEARFGGRYIFHGDLSHNVLPHLPPVDVALIDGDHNWYTVYHELRMLSEVARAADRPLPVMLMHDVGWPYGRRDLYYAPDQIPDESRQPHDQKGMRPGRKQLLPNSGMNATMHNALVEGGPRNGVMTALDDFIAEHDRPLRCVVIPIYYGLAVVVEEDRLSRQPELARVLDGLEAAEGRRELLQLAEETRLRAMVFQHNIMRHGERQRNRLAVRYLDMLKGSLLDEHYLENEMRIRYLVTCHEQGRKPSTPQLREPGRHLRDPIRRLQQAQRNGRDSDQVGASFAYGDMGRVHLDALESCLDDLQDSGVAGDLVECGTRRGGGGIFLRGWLAAHESPDRQVWVADPFRASPPDALDEQPGLLNPANLMPDLAMVRTAFERFDLLDDRVRFLQGPFTDTLGDAPISSVALLRIGADAGPASGEILDLLYDRISVGGAVVIEQYDDEACRKAVEELRARRCIAEPIERVGWAGARWRKSVEAPSTNGQRQAPARPRRAPLAPPLPTDRVSLSVIVVIYNMKREAARTLHALTAGYQEGVTDLDYEVIVVENGSEPEQRLGEELVSSFGPQFRYLDLGQEATSTPVDALNRGLQLARGESIAFMIDGAHVLTPGVLRFAMAGLTTHAPAVVVTQQWYVGPGQQPAALAGGYDEDYEDRLFEKISWPADGYRLFEVGHFIGDRDWLDGLWESNCIFAPRAVLEQVGGFDESFSLPGGGYANLELYERLGTTPGVTVVTMLGEGSFHQAHGGTTTNQVDPAERHRRISSYGKHYADLRGRGFQGTGKDIHYVGALRPSSRRTKARRLVAPAFKEVTAETTNGRADSPLPIPDELRDEYLDALWHSLAWKETTWLGAPVGKMANDLFAYQELLTQVRPDWVIETGTGEGGRALFLASMCELLGSGQVISVGTAPVDHRPEHPRITYLCSVATRPETVQQVHELVGRSRALVVLGTRGTPHVTAMEFESYSPMVSSGSYVVVEDTIVNGRPVWPGFGPGPAEGVKRIHRSHPGEWAPDPTFERFGLTFNPGGFLRRL